MNYTLTHEEVDILTKLIEKFPTDSYFSINSLHAEIFLKPKFPRKEGGVGLKKYDDALTDLRDKYVYRNITRWLIQEGFVIHQPNQQIVDNQSSVFLTDKGKILNAYGSLQRYYQSVEPITENRLIERIPSVIQIAYPYGEFSVEMPDSPRHEVVHINPITMSQEETNEFLRKLNPKLQLIDRHEVYQLDIQTVGYLIMHGFIINRHDIKHPDKIYRQLTDSGRKLKELGSLEAYNKHVEELEKEKERIKLREKGLYNINRSIAAGAIVAAIYYITDLLKSFGKIKYWPPFLSVSTSIFIFIFGIIGGIIIAILIKELKSKNS